MEQLKNESSRQYEYMEEMKKWVQKKTFLVFELRILTLLRSR